MEPEVMEIVVKEISEDLKQSNALYSEIKSICIENKNMLATMEKKLDNKENLKSADIVRSVEQAVASRIQSILPLITELLKNARREFRILLFPEHNAKGYYKIVYGRIIFWLVMLVIAKYMYLLGSQRISNEYENQKYKKAWENLYHQQKSSQKYMQRILDNYQ